MLNKLRSYEQAKESGEYGTYDVTSLFNLFDLYCKEYSATLALILFQVIYACSILVEHHIIHQDLHLSNILLLLRNESANYYYVMKDDNNTIYKVINIRTDVIPLIFDFDRSITDINIQTPICWWNNTMDINDKYDMRFFLTYFSQYFSPFNTEDNRINQTVNKLLYNVESTEEIKDILTVEPLSSWKTIKPDKYDQVKLLFQKQMNSHQAVRWLASDKNSILPCPGTGRLCWAGGAHQALHNNANIRLYDNLRELPLDSSSKIFFPSTIDKTILAQQLNSNESWQKLNIYQKIIVCKPIAESFHGGFGNNALYHHKYLKYKQKYIIRKNKLR